MGKKKARGKAVRRERYGDSEDLRRRKASPEVTEAARRHGFIAHPNGSGGIAGNGKITLVGRAANTGKA